jgi:diguanylate cyclase (GGDEF)-like protein
MTSDSAPTSKHVPAGSSGLLGFAVLSGAICFLIANLAIILLIRLLTVPTAIQFQWWVQVALAMGMLFISSFVCIHLWVHWHRATRRARELLRQIRAGEAPIEELAEIRGGVAPLLAEVREVLVELRRQKAEIARIELETSQRIANRTDALERSLGAVRKQAEKDSLTGLYNRRMLESLLPQALERCRTAQSPLSLMMIDVDDFKLLNDTLGHAAGDDFLRKFGQLVRSTLRESDLAFRYGGDEFVIVLPDNPPAQANLVADRLTSLVDGMNQSLPVPRPPRLSIGVLCSTDLFPDASGELLVLEADRLLYDIKLERKARQMKSRVA